MPNATPRFLTLGALSLAAIFAAITVALHLTNTPGVGLLLTLTIVTALLVVVFAILGLFLNATPAPRMEVTTARPTTPPPSTTATQAAPSAYYDFKGDTHPVIDIEGIGPKYAKMLKAMGIETTARLCYEDAKKIAAGTGAPVKTVKGWQAMAELAKVNGIGKQYAEVLVRGGVSGIDALKTGKADTIANEVTRYMARLDSNVLGQKVTVRRVAAWQKAAAGMRRVRQSVPDA